MWRPARSSLRTAGDGTHSLGRSCQSSSDIARSGPAGAARISHPHRRGSLCGVTVSRVVHGGTSLPPCRPPWPHRRDPPQQPGLGPRVAAPRRPSGLDPEEVAGHSLRAGPATSAAAVPVPERVIAEQAGHKGTACCAATSGRDRFSVRTPPARLVCRKQARRHGRVIRWLLALSPVVRQPRGRGHEAQWVIWTCCWQQGWRSFLGPWRAPTPHISPFLSAVLGCSRDRTEHRSGARLTQRAVAAHVHSVALTRGY